MKFGLLFRYVVKMKTQKSKLMAEEQFHDKSDVSRLFSSVLGEVKERNNNFSDLNSMMQLNVTNILTSIESEVD